MRPCRVENDYNLIKQYYRQFQKGLISEDDYRKKKKKLLDDITRDFRVKKPKCKITVCYNDFVYIILGMLYKVVKIITQEEYEYYTYFLIKDLAAATL